MGQLVATFVGGIATGWKARHPSSQTVAEAVVSIGSTERPKQRRALRAEKPVADGEDRLWFPSVPASRVARDSACSQLPSSVSGGRLSLVTLAWRRRMADGVCP